MLIKTLYRSITIGLVYVFLTACSGSTEPYSASSADYSVTGSNFENTNSIHNGVATLSWLPPTENTDNSSLTNLSGYKIYYGLSPESLTNSITINNIGLTSYVIENLNINTTYYFSMTAVTDQGVESDLSNITSKTTT